MFEDINFRIKALESEVESLDQVVVYRPLEEFGLVRSRALFSILHKWNIKKVRVLR